MRRDRERVITLYGAGEGSVSMPHNVPAEIDVFVIHLLQKLLAG